MDKNKRPRRKKLVERGGLEVFEIRLVQWISKDGKFWTSPEITTPDPTDGRPALVEVLGAMELGKLSILDLYEEEDEDEEDY